MATTKVQKTCFIVTRYFVKSNKSVCCIVRNEQSKNYTTCVHANGATSCTCPAGEKGVKCYHVKHVLAKEAARPALAPISVPEVVVVEVPNTAVFVDADEAMEIEMAWASIRRNLHRAETERIAHKIEASKVVQIVSESIYEKMQKAALNGPRAFSLLR